MPRGQALSATNTNIYEVTVKAEAGEMGEIMVTVNVDNVEELGAVTLMPASPMVDTAVTAALTDPDGTTTNISWEWLISDTENGSYTAIPEATRQCTPRRLTTRPSTSRPGHVR